MHESIAVHAHEGYRLGATRVLLDVLPHVVRSLQPRLHVSVITDGPLAAALRSMSTARSGGTADVVLVNSALAAHELWSHPDECRTVVWVHEAGEALAHLSDRATAALCERADLVLCVSERSLRDVRALGVPESHTALLPPSVSVLDPLPRAVEVERALLAREPTAPLLIGCGEACWRKGADLFVHVARQVGPDVACGWIGRRQHRWARWLNLEVELAELADRLQWRGEVADVAPALASADVLVVTSREDPQPLVPLEAALLGVPTVGFAGTGLDDFVAAGAAVAVPYPDVEALAVLAVDVIGDEERGRALVEAGRVLAYERTPAAIGERLVAALTGGGGQGGG